MRTHCGTHTQLFDTEERLELVRIMCDERLGADAKRLRVVAFGGLVVDFANDNGVDFLVRGLRAFSGTHTWHTCVHLHVQVHVCVCVSGTRMHRCRCAPVAPRVVLVPSACVFAAVLRASFPASGMWVGVCVCVCVCVWARVRMRECGTADVWALCAWGGLRVRGAVGVGTVGVGAFCYCVCACVHRVWCCVWY